MLDDGGHYNKQQITTVYSSIPNINDGGMIVIEDSHTSYMSQWGNPSKFSFINFSKYMIDKINYRFSNIRLKKRNKAEKKEFAERTAAWNKFEKYMAAAPPRFLKRFQKPKGPQPKIESTRVKQKLVTEFKTQGNIVLRPQKQLKKAQGDKLDRLIRDIETEIQKGQEMTKVLKAKKYKNLKLNLGFFFQ